MLSHSTRRLNQAPIYVNVRSSDLIPDRKRHSEVIEKAQRLKHDDSATLQGRGGSTKREEQDSVLTTDEIKVRQQFSKTCQL